MIIIIQIPPLSWVFSSFLLILVLFVLVSGISAELHTAYRSCTASFFLLSKLLQLQVNYCHRSEAFTWMSFSRIKELLSHWLASPFSFRPFNGRDGAEYKLQVSLQQVSVVKKTVSLNEDRVYWDAFSIAKVPPVLCLVVANRRRWWTAHAHGQA